MYIRLDENNVNVAKKIHSSYRVYRARVLLKIVNGRRALVSAFVNQL